MKSIIKRFIPPVIIDLKNHLFKKKEIIHFNGLYNNWDEAAKQSTGYNTDLILQKCKESLIKVRNGEAVFERDSVLFDNIEYSWGVLAGLQKAAIENNNQLCVLDFGGSLGSSYFQNKTFLKNLAKIDWCIVEQKNFVECGKKDFSSEELHFFHSIEECLQLYRPNVLLLSSVMQYLDQPYEWLHRLIRQGIKYIIIDRTPFANSDRDFLTIQHVSKEVYEASYPVWIFDKNLFLDTLMKNYRLIGEFPSIDKLEIRIQGQLATYSGFLFERSI
ncbi:MAG TPA: TIGR04325 family methyltransferase [Chitinophagaceae bacterium]|nr:TIGR04325 family methyltransferase [Chitinophagaceae bacterium]